MNKVIMSQFSIQIFVRDCPTSCFPLRNVQNSKKLVVYFYISHPFLHNESGEWKERTVFVPNINSFFQRYPNALLLVFKIFWLRVWNTQARGSPCISHPVRTALSVIWHFHDVQCKCPNSCSFSLTEVHWAWLNTNKSVQVLMSIATLPPVI